MTNTESNAQGPGIRHGSSQLIMARYGLSTVPTTSPSPVIFNHRYFNLGMRYNNGIVIIDYPGYYRIDIKSYCYEGKTDSKFVGFYLMINSKRQLHQYSRWAAPSQAQRPTDSDMTFSWISDLKFIYYKHQTRISTDLCSGKCYLQTKCIWYCFCSNDRWWIKSGYACPGSFNEQHSNWKTRLISWKSLSKYQ